MPLTKQANLSSEKKVHDGDEALHQGAGHSQGSNSWGFFFVCNFWFEIHMTMKGYIHAKSFLRVGLDPCVAA